MNMVRGAAVMIVGGLLIAPEWCGIGNGTECSASALLHLPSWLVTVAGIVLLFKGGAIFQRPSPARLATMREASDAELQERLAKHRALAERTEYQALRTRHAELSGAADRAEEDGDSKRADIFREDAFAVTVELREMEMEALSDDP